MKKINIALSLMVALVVLSGCNSKPKEEVKTYKYTTDVVYKETCLHCHGAKGEGVAEKKSPAINKLSIQELEMALFDIKNGGLGQSTASEHEVMEHNMKKLTEKGYDYDIKAMANYIFTTFNQAK
ncbi:c-type cytochrome [Sulfurospirillum barnesii]|uniref:Cytochrome c553 n=1 Tax=Sulfurospirillum barnesii (strain ATCC 700032 / DSM 10660 / SES-3) TaxID=760154 RepID=I3XXC2_SULBS|nr:c-type cytochrome [Sulfurospirillum barnesii]AFL68596.1 cytochrome c553 [Sulfurospirillum barnesii SES-3]